MLPEGAAALPYLPGQTKRPAEGAFDHLKGISQPLEHCQAWREGLRFYQSGFYWEAHELWEAVWMAAPANSAEKIMVQGAIQMANARLKQRMGRAAASVKLARMAEGLMSEAWRRKGGSVMGLGLRRDADMQYNAENALSAQICEL